MREFYAYLDITEWPRTPQGTIKAAEGLLHLLEFMRRQPQLSLLLDPAPNDIWSPTGPWLLEVAGQVVSRGEWGLAQSCRHIADELERMRARVEGAADFCELLEIEDDPAAANLGRLRLTAEALTAFADRWREVAQPDIPNETRQALIRGEIEADTDPAAP